MTPAPDRLLLRLEWRVLRRLDGRIQGAYRTPYRGSGLDFAGLRPYVEEDDARHIDWNATARLDEPQARLFGRGGNRVGAVLHDGAATRVVPPGTGRAHALRIGHEIDRTAAPPPVTTDFAVMLGAVAALARRRSLIIIVSDFIGTGEWDKPLLRLVHRHDVVALRVVDAADDALPEAGLLLVEDAEHEPPGRAEPHARLHRVPATTSTSASSTSRSVPTRCSQTRRSSGCGGSGAGPST